MVKEKNVAWRIRLSDISHRGLTINEILPATSINERLNSDLEANEEPEIFFAEDLKVSIVVSHLPEGGEIKGTLSGQYSQTCGRCVEVKPRGINIKLNFQLKPKKSSDASEEIDDIGLIFYSGDHVNLHDTLVEQVMLEISPYFMPALNKEKCVLCKKTFNDGPQAGAKTNTLAAALSKINLKN